MIGIDPGLSTGISFIDYVGDSIAGAAHIQVDGKSALATLSAMLTAYYSDPERVGLRVAGVESFITGQSAGTKGQPAEATRQLVFEFSEKLQLWGYSVQLRKAADVKLWGTDKRLKAAGIIRPPENRHANDASRHALYAAVHDLHKPDPLR